MEKEVMTVLNDWYNEERGNRVTSNNMEALARKMLVVLNVGNTPQQPKEAKDEQDNGTSS